MTSTAESKSPSKSKRKMNMTTTGTSSLDDDSGSSQLVELKRRMQVVSTNWVQETSFTAEDYACMFVTITPQQGPIVVVPSLSEESITGTFQLSVFSDKRLAGAVMLDEAKNALQVGTWTADTAGGCHLYSPPFEMQKAATWVKNPRYHLIVHSRTRVHITLGRIERSWRSQLAKDAVGCMLGLYVCHGEVSLEATLDACTAESPYLIVPCTYEPGKVGEFMLRITSDEAAFEVVEAAPPKPKEN